MISTARITATFFTGLLNRLGIRPPFAEGFNIINTVQPVSLVDSDITLSAVSTTQTLDTPATNGELAAPAANATYATGPVAAMDGVYAVTIAYGCTNEGGIIGTRLVRRNAADTADIWSVMINPSRSNELLSMNVVLKAGERIRLNNGASAGGAGSAHQGAIWQTQVS